MTGQLTVLFKQNNLPFAKRIFVFRPSLQIAFSLARAGQKILTNPQVIRIFAAQGLMAQGKLKDQAEGKSLSAIRRKLRREKKTNLAFRFNI